LIELLGMVYLFLSVAFFQIIAASLDNFDAMQFHYQSKFAQMLSIHLSPNESVGQREKHLRSTIEILKLSDDAMKLAYQFDLLKELIKVIDDNDNLSQKKLSQVTLDYVNGINNDFQDKALQQCVVECRAFLVDFLKTIQKEHIKIKNENNELRKKLVVLQNNYNASFRKNFFDFFHDRALRRFFGAMVGLIVFMNAILYCELDSLEQMILTMVGLSGFFVIGVAPFV
jgi:hypothetical protein